MLFQSGIDEEVHVDFTPVALHAQDLSRLARVVASLQEHVIRPSRWDLHVRETHITLRKKQSPNETISLFIDRDNRLARDPDLRLLADCLQDAPLVLGVELTGHDPATRDALRSALRERFHDHYCDPRRGARKVSVKPTRGHYLDVVFLPRGGCSEDLIPSELNIELALERLRRLTGEG